MLKTYTPIVTDPIFKLHELTEHLVCEVWACADNNEVASKLHQEFLPIYENYEWVKLSVDKIYKYCNDLEEKEVHLLKLKEAFIQNNKIEELCNGLIKPILVEDLPVFIGDIQLLFKRFYTELLDRSLVTGNKKIYYDTLYSENKFSFCPCCGYYPMKTWSDKGHEAYDHYLPQTKFPFSSVNFRNLVPLCHVCNSTSKGAKNPIENGRIVFYPFGIKKNDIKICVEIPSVNKIEHLYKDEIIEDNDIIITLIGEEQERINSWDEIFEIKGRFFSRMEASRNSWINRVKKYHAIQKRRGDFDFNDSFNEVIEQLADPSYQNDGFLAAPFLESLKPFNNIIEAMEEVSILKTTPIKE